MYFDYLKFLLNSKNEHSLHSPFLFDFYTKVVKIKYNPIEFEQIEGLRKRLLNDKREIEITDFGAGSKSISTNKRNLRKISKIASKSAKSQHLAQLFYRIIQYFGYKSIIDLGTSLGLTTSYQALATSGGKVISFEGCPNIAQIAQSNFHELDLKNIELVIGNIDQTLLEKVEKVKQIDFAFFDANHRIEPTLRYFEICLTKVHEDSCFVFDDIYWSDEMREAWAKIKNHPSVTLTIDLFWVGIVFFRKKQPKQHYILRM